jgi:hypothetical protein
MMKTAHTGKPDNLHTRRRSRLERPCVRCISEPRMNAFSVVVGDDVFTKPSRQMPKHTLDGSKRVLATRLAGVNECGCRPGRRHQQTSLWAIFRKESVHQRQEEPVALAADARVLEWHRLE